MNLYVYSDESGVFDCEHNDYFVFGGVILIGKEQNEEWNRKYAKVEKNVRTSLNLNKNIEIKATTIETKYKNKKFRSLNQCYKFGCIVEEKRVNANIWRSKKDKQRYLDYVYKIAVKRAFEDLISNNVINPQEIKRIYFNVDEHSTATNGRYELKESLEQEFKYGTYNFNYSMYFPPIFSNMKEVCLHFCDSSAPNKRLVRAADIVANKIFYYVEHNEYEKINNLQNLHIIKQP